MKYVIDIQHLYPLIDEEISRVAASSYGDDSSPLYDSIVLHSNDRDEIVRLVGDASNAIVKRNYDILTVLPGENPVFSFCTPDIPEGYEDIADDELTRFIVLNVCAAWFQARAKDKVEEFSLRGQAALDKASAILHTRKAPQR